MNPEWQRRAVAIFLTVLSIAPVRKIEPILAAGSALPGVWITRIAAIAILILCFKLTDMIPDDEWRFKSIWRPRTIHGVMLMIMAIMLAMLYGVAR